MPGTLAAQILLSKSVDPRFPTHSIDTILPARIRDGSEDLPNDLSWQSESFQKLTTLEVRPERLGPFPNM